MTLLTLLDLVPRWALALAIIVLAAGLGLSGHRLAGAQVMLAKEQASHQHDLSVIASEAATASESARAEEQRRIAANQEIARHADLQQDVIRTAAVHAISAGDGLRQRTVSIASRCDQGPGDTAAAIPGPAASSPGELLADVQRRLAEAAGQLAAVADLRGVAGAACEAAYAVLK